MNKTYNRRCVWFNPLFSQSEASLHLKDLWCDRRCRDIITGPVCFSLLLVIHFVFPTLGQSRPPRIKNTGSHLPFLLLGNRLVINTFILHLCCSSPLEQAWCVKHQMWTVLRHTQIVLHQVQTVSCPVWLIQTTQ